MSFIFHIILKATLLLVGIKLGLLAIKKDRYSLRHLLISWGMLGLLLLPFLMVFTPSIKMTLPTLAQQEVQFLQQESTKVTQQAKEYTVTNNSLPAINTLSNNKELISSDKSLLSTIPLVKEESTTRFSLIQIIAFIWLIGVCFTLVKFLIGFIFLFKTTRRSQSFTLPETLQKLLPKRINVRVSNAVKTPMAFGVFYPIILLPQAAKNWEVSLLKIVLLHEYMHIQRKDYGWHLVSILAVILYWWHPLIWILKRQHVLEREKACDAAVLSAGTPISSYATSLVTIAKRLSLQQNINTLSAMTMAKNTQLKTRIMAILKFKKQQTTSRKMQYAILAVVVFILPIIAGFTPIREQLIVPTIKEILPSSVPSTKITPLEISPITTPTLQKEIFPKEETQKVVDLVSIGNEILPSQLLPAAHPTALSIESQAIEFSSFTSKVPVKSSTIPTGLYGEWQEGKSTYKIWTYGGYQTLKNIPFIQVTEDDAFVIIEETRKTLLGEKKFLLAITQAPEKGGIIQTFLEGQPQGISGGYQKGESLLFWWKNGEWGGFWDNSKNKWIAQKLNGIARELELSDYKETIFQASQKDVYWWSVIQKQQAIKEKRFYPDGIATNQTEVDISDIGTTEVSPPSSENLLDFPYRKIDLENATYFNKKKVGKTKASKTKSGCTGCSDLTKTKFATVLKTTTKTGIIKQFNMHLNHNKFESITFRLNLYKMEDGAIKYRLNKEAIEFGIGKYEGWVGQGLEQYNIPVQGEVLVVLEPIDVRGEKRELFFSLSPTFWMYRPLNKDNKQHIEGLWENSFAWNFIMK